MEPSERELLERTAALAADFIESLDERRVFPEASIEELGAALGGPLPDRPSDPLEVIERLAADAERGVVATPSGRYFGYVIGGSVPAALAADWLTSAWDQCAAFGVLGPSASVVEEVAGGWLKELFGLAPTCSFALTTGCQMAHVTALAVARHAVLERAGWDLAEDGLAGSPPITVIAGAARHTTLDRALRLLGIGAAQIQAVEADDQGRIVAAALEATLERTRGPVIVCAQAGEVNTGSFDPLADIASLVRGTDAWLHVDGAFGLWAAASPELSHLVEGIEHADSCAADGHKWLNVPYDCGLAFCADPDAHRAAMTARAAYYAGAGDWHRDAFDWTPESSRRARGFPLYAALRSLGRSGVADLVDRCCARARQAAEGVAALPGCTLLNDVVLNQVLFRFEDERTTDAVIDHVQAGGEAWLGGTTWEGRRAIRLSVSSWRTSEDDIDRTLAALADGVRAAAYAQPAAARASSSDA
jgi:glutamate/tyrosine decarboxylase-like PLP-dependent enzyme